MESEDTESEYCQEARRQCQDKCKTLEMVGENFILLNMPLLIYSDHFDCCYETRTIHLKN